ncbi:MAG: ROK family transcriptional regulator [Dictyoglomi bacterium]|nr:ROK family transcriptional regulator [Dictyoglomota bacterium]HHV81843.1 ROK family transcriptional regulator [bacterium]HOK30152.1 ROK family transcriptional regulator [bacterium]
MNLRGVNHQLVKIKNRNLILRLIYERGSISRQEISRLIGLTPATVTNITGELLEKGFITELSNFREKSSAGRKAVPLAINPTAGYVIGVDIRPKIVRMSISDLLGRLSNIESFPYNSNRDELIETLVEKLQVLTEDRDILGIGIGVPGLVDSSSGEVKISPNLGWKNLNLSGPIEKSLRIPVTVENNVRVMALGERWFGKGKKSDNFILVYVSLGVGSGIVISGKIYKGINNSAGEIGHTVVSEDGELCNCGKKGCLETFASARAIVKNFKGTSLDEDSDIDEIKSAIEKGDKRAIEIVNRAGHYLGVGISNLVNILDPEMIILAGRVIRLGKTLLFPMRESLESRLFSTNKIRIEISELGKEIGLYGASALALEKFFYDKEEL